jgi:hypothetical protein
MRLAVSRGFTYKIVEDFDYWSGEQIKQAIRDNPDDEQGLRWELELMDIDSMEIICERLRNASELAMKVAHVKEQIRHMREDHDGLKEAEVEQRRAKADEFERDKLPALQAALTEALR